MVVQTNGEVAFVRGIGCGWGSLRNVPQTKKRGSQTQYWEASCDTELMVGTTNRGH